MTGGNGDGGADGTSGGIACKSPGHGVDPDGGEEVYDSGREPGLGDREKDLSSE